MALLLGGNRVMELAAVATVLAALGGVIKLILDKLDKMEERHDQEMRQRDATWQAALLEHRVATEKFLGNHMSGNTKALEALVTVVESLAASVDQIMEEGNGHNAS